MVGTHSLGVARDEGERASLESRRGPGRTGRAGSREHSRHTGAGEGFRTQRPEGSRPPQARVRL